MTTTRSELINGGFNGSFAALDEAGMVMPGSIIKRDGRIVAFDAERITNAMRKCFASMGRTPQVPVEELTGRVVNIIAAKTTGLPTVEGVQDVVETVLLAAGEFEAAKHYILYRAEHAKKRIERPIPEAVRQAFAESERYFPTALQKFQFFDKYSRFNYELGRRETWIETVDRSVAFLHELAGDRLPSTTYERIRRAILEMRSMPSMRLLAMAGPAARRNNVAIYNCSYQPVESIDSFVEALSISMSGCGVGFSVEGRYVENFPRIRRQRGVTPRTMVVEDSAEGWTDALRAGLEAWFDGGDMRFDLSQLRSAGAPLRTKGGRASGPEPLRVMLDFVRSRILARQGSFLRPIDAHDMMCSVGNAAVSGGVRRTAMISLFDYDDDEMRLSKSGDFERENSQRWNANNSTVWPEEGLMQPEFISQFLEMVQSGRGEPGIFNRHAANQLKPARRHAAEFGTNPCVTGDTWIAVADGRGRVRMADLVAVGDDVDVFTVKDGELVIRTMRNPRKTGTQVPVFRVTFADGTYIRATANHRFVTLDGQERTTAELQANDALTAMTVFSYQKRGLPAVRKVGYDQLGSYRMVQFGSYRKSEHRMIYAHHANELALTGAAVKTCDLPIQYRDGTTYVTRACEVCGQSYEVRFNRREQATCGAACAQKLYYRLHGSEERRQALQTAHADAKVVKRQRQVAVYNDLVFTLGRHPSKQEWASVCKNQGISAEITRVSSPFQSWQALVDEAQATNHRVVAVEPDGYEDVYTGTVDDTHTFFSIGCERLDRQGRTEMAYVLSWQCGEIVLRPWQFCNLTAAVARHDDTFDSLREKVEVATIIGTIQSMATHFPGLRPQWQRNCEEERLLGVDITGQMDSPLAQDAGAKERLRQIAIEVNRQTSLTLGINQAAAITCVKPSGNCRPWYSLTSTSAGLLTLQELLVDHPEDTNWAEVTREVYALQGQERARIVRTYNNGVSPTLSIRMNYGLTVESTPNHRWFVSYRHERGKGMVPVEEWVPACELRPDDVLDVQIGAYTNECHTKFTRVNSLALKMRGNAQSIKQPEEMNEEIAWLLGYLWGDGSLSPGGFRIRFIDNHQEHLLKAQRILEEQFGVEANMYSASEKRRAWTLEVASVYLWHWLIRNSVFKYFADQIDIIPQCVRSSARNDIIAFLAGLLDADGWSGLTQETQAGKFTFSTADRLFARHIQDVSWAVGVPLGCSLNSVGENLQQHREIYLLTGCVYVQPDAFAVLLRNSVKLQTTAARADFTRWEWQTEAKRLHPGKINAIAQGETVATYDLEVEGNHWFYAGAVRSHNSSQLLNCASGLHTRWSPYYIRNVRVAAHSPIFKVLRDAGAPMSPENGQTAEHATTWVIHFPVRSPEGAITRKDRSAIAQCEFWLQNKTYWTEHNPSCTIVYQPDEVIDLMKWVWEHRDLIGGLSFLPAFDAKYENMPYVEITREEYERLAPLFPVIDFSKIYRYEEQDLTNAAQELACSSGTCEIDL